MDADSLLDHVYFPESWGRIGRGGLHRTAALSRWRQSAGKAAPRCRRSWAPGLPPSGCSSRSRSSAAKLPLATFTRAIWIRCPPSCRVMFAYAQAFLEQVMVSVACNGAHSLKQRLARWLLMMRDRCDHDALQITHGLLGEMLGVQRPSITNAAEQLERAGLIERGRRQVTILDRPGLIQASCECYPAGARPHRISPPQDLRLSGQPFAGDARGPRLAESPCEFGRSERPRHCRRLSED